MLTFKKALVFAGAASFLATSPAAAAIHEYTMNNGDVLTINTDTQTGTFKGRKIDATFTSAGFADFAGGPAPRFSFILDSLDGTRLKDGKWLTDNPLYADTTHPQMLKAMDNGRGATRFNLWAWWGDPISAGDYIRNGGSYAQVPAPGMLALLALALGALGWRRRWKGSAA